ncbi:cation diffusion facilitator family transporter [Breznakiella homolactica]|uniref:Cation transporter n=1 Tax=Breznakiella homolactica TaxID=2798577 RepID=A0A7T7XJT1_9SPIR|nr:cation diffusion facilitator family transporter [Breznakiella homolactica]QQO07600.1 cation diffusion facilitator family transporter [Breznakiella homolactica]
MEKANEKIAIRVSWHTVIGNVLLSAFKLAAGIIGQSAAMLSDAVHSLSDVLSTFIVMIGVKAAGKDADKEHPYGHERFESVAAIILAVFLCVTGIGIGYGGVQSIIAGRYETLAVPGLLALVAAIVSIAVKEAMYWYTRAAAKKINSGALMADAWHHRSDALSSVGSFVGILGARMGFPVLDAVACIVICVFIVKAAGTIFMDAINKMTDKACDEETAEEIRGVILAQDNVRGIDLLRTRLFGDKIYVDVEIRVDGSIPLADGHGIAHAVHDAIESRFGNVKHCMVHVNPQ